MPLLLAAVWLVSIALVWPSGEFPLNDDWDYAKSARSLLETGRLTLSPEARVTLVAQAAWGALFALPFGFSFAALRASTLVAALGGTLATYGLARTLGGSRSAALVAALTVALSPIWFVLSFTFMTDVPFSSVVALGLLAGSRFLLHRGFASLVSVSVASLVAVLIRPTGLALPAAFLVASLLTCRRLRDAPAAGLPIVASLLALALWQVWALAGGLGGLGNIQSGELSAALAGGPVLVAREAARNSGVALLYLGLFSLPLVIAVAPEAVDGRRRGVGAVAIGLASVIVGLALVSSGTTMPLSSNVLYDVGLGPMTLRDAFFFGPSVGSTAPSYWWALVTIASCAAAAMLLLTSSAGAARAHRDGKTRVVVFLVLTGGFSFAPLAVAGFLDRYLLVLLPPTLALAAAGTVIPRRWLVSAAGVVLLGFWAFSVSGTRDYFGWNRARWAALDRLVTRGIPPAWIDGGFEFNGWLTYDPTYRGNSARSWWWVDDDRFRAAFGPMAGYQEVDREPYRRLLPPGDGAIVILERLQ